MEKLDLLYIVAKNVEWYSHSVNWFGYLMSRTDSLEKTLMLGKIEGRRRGGDRE